MNILWITIYNAPGTWENGKINWTPTFSVGNAPGHYFRVIYKLGTVQNFTNTPNTRHRIPWYQINRGKVSSWKVTWFIANQCNFECSSFELVLMRPELRWSESKDWPPSQSRSRGYFDHSRSRSGSTPGTAILGLREYSQKCYTRLPGVLPKSTPSVRF